MTYFRTVEAPLGAPAEADAAGTGTRVTAAALAELPGGGTVARDTLSKPKMRASPSCHTKHTWPATGSARQHGGMG
jgi:hypothetical protein